MFVATGAIGGAPASRVYVDTQGQLPNQQSYTFDDFPIGTEKPTRYLVICVGWSNGLSLVRPLTSLTVDGVAASIIRQDVSPVNLSFRSAIAAIAWPNGATADIVPTFQTSTVTDCAVSVYALYHLRSQTPFANNGSGQQGAGSVATTLDIPARGIAIAAITSSGAAIDVSVSGLTEDNDVNNDARVTVASLQGMSAETARIISASKAGTPAWAISTASWK